MTGINEQSGAIEGGLEGESHFHEQLEELRIAMVELGRLAVANIRRACAAVLENRVDEVEPVREADQPINELYAELDSEIFRILALQQPVASDLRFLVAANRIVYEIERSADLGVNVVRSLDRIEGIPDGEIRSVFEQLAEASTAMFERGIEAVATMDPDIGVGAEAEDQRTDDLTGRLYGLIMAREDSFDLDAAVSLFYMGRFLERIGDHGVNIAHHVTYAVTARFPEDQ